MRTSSSVEHEEQMDKSSAAVKFMAEVTVVRPRKTCIVLSMIRVMGLVTCSWIIS